MTIAEAVISKVLQLSPEQQQQVLTFVEGLETPQTSKEPRESLYGLWKDLDIDLSEEEIAAARQEMWGRVERENFE